MPARLAAIRFVALLAVSAAVPAAVPAAAQQGGVPVDAAEAKADTVVIEADAVGTLLSNESVVVRPEIAGRIVVVGFEEGRPVSGGQLMFQFDDSIYAAELEDAQARLELARRTYNRAQELVERGAGTQTARDEATAALQTARAAVQLAEARLTKTTIEAPFEGIAGLRRVSVGDYVAEGQEMVNLEDIDPLKVDFAVPERFLADLELGQAVRVTADAFPGENFVGEVYAVNPQIDPASRSVQVRARLDNSQRRLRPGLFVRVNLELARREQAVIVPEDAIVPRGEERFVFRIVDGKAALTPVVLGQRRFGEVEVREGLAAGDTVVTAGQLKLRDGAPVTVRGAGEPQG
jgi:membrane fusion protein (multidrug efflux system)